ncbi:MAG: hypothetical protein ACRDP8_26350 [Actinopolymorphaceae bacterium]
MPPPILAGPDAARPLASDTRAEMEARLGHDFSDVPMPPADDAAHP